MSDPNSHHYLDGKWDLYYHLPNDSNWSLNSYNTIAKNIDTVEQVYAINEAINEQTVKYSMLFLMRSGITPLWEDPKNRLGGCFSFKVINKQVYDIWKKLFYSICGESLCINKEHNQLINGITISPKKHFPSTTKYPDLLLQPSTRKILKTLSANNKYTEGGLGEDTEPK